MDRLACQVEGYATTTAGQPYQNHYMFLLQFSDGKITRIAEYMDTRLVEQMGMRNRLHDRHRQTIAPSTDNMISSDYQRKR